VRPLSSEGRLPPRSHAKIFNHGCPIARSDGVRWPALSWNRRGGRLCCCGPRPVTRIVPGSRPSSHLSVWIIAGPIILGLFAVEHLTNGTFPAAASQARPPHWRLSIAFTSPPFSTPAAVINLRKRAERPLQPPVLRPNNEGNNGASAVFFRAECENQFSSEGRMSDSSAFRFLPRIDFWGI